MSWTSEPPAEEGWYWMREPGQDAETVLVTREPEWIGHRPRKLQVLRVGCEEETYLPLNAEWYGPLTPPK